MLVIRFVGTVEGFLTSPGHWVIHSGTGGLANLHGQGEFLQVGASGTCSGQIHFDP